MTPTYSVGLLGARGHVGGELVRLLAGHPQLRLTHAASRQDIGRPLAGTDIVLEDMSPETVARWPVDVAILALPNGHAATYAALARPDTVVIDLSADHRFDPRLDLRPPRAHTRAAPRRPPHRQPRLLRHRHPARPSPRAELLEGPAHRLRRLRLQRRRHHALAAQRRGASARQPARLCAHRPPPRARGQPPRSPMSCFMPHVAAWFRGIHLTLTLPLAAPTTPAALLARYQHTYKDEPLVHVTSAIPEVQTIAGRHDVHIGGFAVDAKHAVVIVTLDNLLKGAASQALQNLNLALGLPERLGVPHDPPLSSPLG
jgi:N-acetyl-gamma-glutamyl-phosphate reductase